MTREGIKRVLVASGLAVLLLTLGTALPLHAAPPLQHASLQQTEDATVQSTTTVTTSAVTTPTLTTVSTLTMTQKPTAPPPPTATPRPTLAPSPLDSPLASPTLEPSATPTLVRPTFTSVPTVKPTSTPMPTATAPPIPKSDRLCAEQLALARGDLPDSLVCPGLAADPLGPLEEETTSRTFAATARSSRSVPGEHRRRRRSAPVPPESGWCHDWASAGKRPSHHPGP